MGLWTDRRGEPGTRRRETGTASRPAAVIGALLGLAAATEAIAHAAMADSTVPYAFMLCLLAVVTTLPLAFLPPIPAAAIVSTMNVLSLAAFRTLTVAGLGAQVIALYRLGRVGPPHRGALALTTAATTSFLLLALISHPGTEARLLTLVMASAAPAAALAGTVRQAQSEAAMHGAAQQAVVGSLLEHTARGERARIARELHDVVAHHISVIAVQAETARLATPGMPPAGAQRLSEIGDTARAGLTEMRRLLGVLREDADMEAEPEDRHPQPGLEELTALIDDARDAASTSVRLIVRGRPVTFDPGVELTAFRIVQEALTNARRHAPGTAVDVQLDYADDSLRLRIRDNGPGPPRVLAVDGHGLLGMRERAAAIGGQLRTGPAPGGGFLIEATLPAKVETA